MRVVAGSTTITSRAYHDCTADVTRVRHGLPYGVAAKRRLPVLPSGGDADADPARAPWQWVGFGTLAIFVVWVPLAAVAATVASHMVVRVAPGVAEPGPAAIAAFVGMSALALALAAIVGGFVVGRWGGAGAGVRQASLAGFAASLVAVIASWASFGVSLSALVVVPFALPFAALGGKLGRSARR